MKKIDKRNESNETNIFKWTSKFNLNKGSHKNWFLYSNFSVGYRATLDGLLMAGLLRQPLKWAGCVMFSASIVSTKIISPFKFGDNAENWLKCFLLSGSGYKKEYIHIKNITLHSIKMTIVHIAPPHPVSEMKLIK